MKNKLRSFCIDKDYFTCGSNIQYMKMFDLVDQGASIHDIALIIWLCSKNVELAIIEEEVADLFKSDVE